MSDPEVLDREPFPRLQWRNGEWEGRAVLPGWAGFQARQGPYCGLSGDGPSDGEVRLSVFVDSEVPEPPGEAQTRAWRHLVENETAVTAAVLRAILDEYPALREMYGYDGDDPAEPMPDVTSAAGLRELIGLSNVHVLEGEKDGMAYVGFELGCTWDEEHGLGVMTHGGRVLEVGQADTSFSYWPDDEEDTGLGRPAPTAPAAPRPKKWWEFWK